VPAVRSTLLKLRLPQNSNPIAPTIFSIVYRSDGYASSAGTEVNQKLSEDRANSSLQPFECFIKRYVVDASSNIVHEVAVWIAATTPEQLRECYFHLSVEEREIILSSLANWTLLPQREELYLPFL